jgi:hypothetical protein
VPWAAALVWILLRLPDQLVDGRNADATTRRLALGSLAFPAYYLGLSWAISLRGAIRGWRRKPVDLRPPGDDMG